MHAVEESNPKQVRSILETGLDPNLHSPGLKSTTPLTAAAIANNVEAIVLLLDAGADIELGVGQHLASPAHHAAFHGSTEALAILLDHGGDPHAVTSNFGSLIFAGAYRGHRETVRMLLDRDLGIDLQEGQWRYDTTPLHYAYRHGDEVMIQMLIDAGADTEAATTDGRLLRDFTY